MSDIVNNPGETNDAHAPTLLGPLLQEARQKRKLTVEDVSNRLRISPRQVRALEADDYAALPEPVITRGFIRNYSRMLDIEAEPLLVAYRASAPFQSPRAISIQSEHILILGGDKRHWRMYIVVSLLIAALVGAWLLFMDYRPQSTAPVSNLLATAESTVANEAGGTAKAVDEKKTYSEPLPIPALPAAERVAETAVSEPVASDAKAQADSTVAAKATAKLKFSFTQPAWLSVKGRDNKMIVNKNKPANSEEALEGQPPFTIIIGNATGSSLIYGDKQIDLAPHTKYNVVRLTLE